MFDEEEHFCVFCEGAQCDECTDREPLCDWCDGLGCDQCVAAKAKDIRPSQKSSWSQMREESTTAADMQLCNDKDNNCNVLDTDAIFQHRQEFIDNVKNSLCIGPTDADLLLRYHRYDMRKLENAWFTDPADCRSLVGISGSDFAGEEIPEMVQCMAWCDVVPTTTAHRLSCGHWLCDDCWTGYLDSEVSAGLTCTLSRCPSMNSGEKKCRELITYQTFAKYVTKEQLEKLTRWLVASYVDCSPTLRWCPKPGCDYAVELIDPEGSSFIECRCGHHFCFNCLLPPHGPCPCDLVLRWNSESGANAQEIATQKLIAATAKQCPNCQTWITKDRHCNHMQCTKCCHHFCWLCLAPFTRETGHNDYYKCATYNAKQARGEVSSEEKLMLESNKYLQKLMLHQKKFDDCKEDVARVMKKHQQLIELQSNNPLVSAEWILDALTTTAKAYRALQWTHVLMYFMKSGSAKDLFSKDQEMLLTLSRHLDRSLEEAETHERQERKMRNMGKHKSKDTDVDAPTPNALLSVLDDAEVASVVKHKTKTMKKLYRTLMFSSNNSLEEVLQYNPDEESNKWACVICVAVNDDHFEAGSRGRVTKCRTCGACRAHGEPDCRVPKCGIHPAGANNGLARLIHDDD